MQNATFLQLFAALEGSESNPGMLDPEDLEVALQNLHDISAESCEDDLRIGPPKWKVKIVGDPEIVDQHNNYFHYLGPALAVCLDDHGVVRTLEFIGVEGGKKDSNYLKEVWQYNVKTQRWKYRDLRGMQGVPAHRVVCQDRAYYGRDWTSQGDLEFHAGEDWTSEKDLGERPPRQFLAKFKPDSETFLINLRSGTFCRGPEYRLLQRVVEDPRPFVKPLIAACGSPKEWMKQAADATRVIPVPGISKKKWQPPKPSYQEQAVQVAQVVFGLTAAAFH